MVRPPGAVWGGPAASESERESLRLELEGGYDAETFDELGRGVWLGAVARFRIAVDEPGRLFLLIAAPRPTAADPRIVLGGEVIAGPLEIDHRQTMVVVPVDAPAAEAGFIEFDLRSDPYQPSAHGGGSDDRELGVVLLGVDFLPESPTEGWWNVRQRE